MKIQINKLKTKTTTLYSWESMKKTPGIFSLYCECDYDKSVFENHRFVVSEKGEVIRILGDGRWNIADNSWHNFRFLKTDDELMLTLK